MPKFRSPHWSDKMLEAVKTLYPTQWTGDVADALGVSKSAVMQMAFFLGVKKEKRMRGSFGTISGRWLERGYAVISFHGVPGQVPEHRWVMERKLSRKLTRKEVVHHINGRKTDNRVGNLMLFKSRRAHELWHRRHPEIGKFNPIRHKPVRKIIDNKLRCGKCKKEYPIHRFNLDRTRHCGYSSWCKNCVRDFNRSYYKRSKQEEKKYVSTDYRRNAGNKRR